MCRNAFKTSIMLVIWVMIVKTEKGILAIWKAIKVKFVAWMASKVAARRVEMMWQIAQWWK